MAESRARVCLSMIVRDEAPVIERCLRSVRPFIDSWAIVDTGSTDGTQSLVRRCLRDLPGELIERPWVDFATNRNQALALARGYGEYAFFIDADDVLEGAEGFGFGELAATGYVLEMLVAESRSWVNALARLDLDCTWTGVLHEVLSCTQPHEWRVLPGARIRVIGDGARGRKGLREKYAGDAELLRGAIEREPGNARYRWYLAHSLRESGQYAAALAAYRECCALELSAEEVYFCKLMIPVLGEHDAMQDREIVTAYLDAFEFRPQRAETFTRLAHFLLKRGRFAEAREYARRACGIPATTDTVLVDAAAYGWRPRDDLVRASFALGDYRECIEICRQMLQDPQLPRGDRARVERNLQRAIEQRAAGHSRNTDVTRGRTND